MKKNLFLIVALGFSFTCLAQVAHLPANIRNVQDNVVLDRMQEADGSKYTEVKGSPYLTEFFVPATIYPDDDLFFIKYNAVDDEIEVKLSATKTIVLDNSFKEYIIVLKENNETYTTLNEIGKDQPGYFIEVKKTNTASLYKKKTKKYIPEKIATDNYSTSRPASFSKEEEVYYIQLAQEGPVRELPTKKNSFLELFQNNQNDIKDYIGKNKIKLNKEVDLVQLFTFIESL